MPVLAPTSHAPDFARLLRAFRALAGLSQEQLSEAAGLAYRTVESYERRKALPSRGVIRKLGALTGAYGITEEALTLAAQRAFREGVHSAAARAEREAS